MPACWHCSAFVPFFFCMSERSCFCHLFMNTCVFVCVRLVNCPCICVTDVYRGGQLARIERLQGIAAQRPPSLHWGLSPCSNSCAVSSHQVTRSDWTQGAVAADLPAVELFIHMLRSDWRLLDVKHNLKGERISRLDAHERQAEDCSCVLKPSLLCSSLNFQEVYPKARIMDYFQVHGREGGHL